MVKLSDLVKNIGDMTPEQLQEHVREIRSNKYIIKPAVKKRADDVVKKEKNTERRGINKLLDNLTPEQKAELIKQLEAGKNG